MVQLMAIPASGSEASGVVLAEDPGVGFDWAFFPFMGTLREAVGGVLAVTLVVSVALLVLGALVWAAGRLMGSQGMQRASAAGMLVVVVAAIVIGGANAIVGWGSNLDTGF